MFSLGFKLSCDAPEFVQFRFQDPATTTMEKLLEFNKHLLFVIMVIVVLVTWLLLVTISNFEKFNTQKSQSFFHSNILEIIWSLLFTLILLNLASPSFTLLYFINEELKPFVDFCVTFTSFGVVLSKKKNKEQEIVNRIIVRKVKKYEKGIIRLRNKISFLTHFKRKKIFTLKYIQVIFYEFPLVQPFLLFFKFKKLFYKKSTSFDMLIMPPITNIIGNIPHKKGEECVTLTVYLRILTKKLVLQESELTFYTKTRSFPGCVRGHKNGYRGIMDYFKYSKQHMYKFQYKKGRKRR